MPKIWRVYSGSDGQSHIAEEAPAMKPFTDTEGAYGEAAPTQAASSITFRMSPPGYVLDWHFAPSGGARSRSPGWRRSRWATARWRASVPATSCSRRT